MADSVPNLKGRVAVVTGATSGLGWWVACGLAALRATTVVVGRAEARTIAAAAEIASRTGNPEVYPVPATDLALRTEVVRVADVLLQRYPRIHLLVNNAGAYYRRRAVTSEGIERTLALNVLTPFLLTSRLLPRLVESAPSRVVMIGSGAHHGHQVDFTDLQGDRHYWGWRTYGRSKLELLLLSREFAHRLHGVPVTVNTIHPGFVDSHFGRNNGGGVALAFTVLEGLFGRRPERAAAEVVRALTDPAMASTSGEYLSRGRVRPGSPPSRDRVAALRLYEACELLATTPSPPPPLPVQAA